MPSAAVLIGVAEPAPSTFDEGVVHWPQLHGVANDLAAVREMLLQAAQPLPALSVITLVEPVDTTAANIKKVLDAVVARLEPGDTFVLMLDGHGYHVPDTNGDDGDGWDEVFIASDGVPVLDDEFAARWATVDKRVTIIGLVDSCFADTSGDFLVNPASVLPPPSLTVTVRIRDCAPRLFFSASLATQAAFETPITGQQRGVLSAALTDVWAMTRGARKSYATLFGYAQELAAQYDDRQTTRVRFTGRELATIEALAPFSVSAPAVSRRG